MGTAREPGEKEQRRLRILQTKEVSSRRLWGWGPELVSDWSPRSVAHIYPASGTLQSLIPGKPTCREWVSWTIS